MKPSPAQATRFTEVETETGPLGPAGICPRALLSGDLVCGRRGGEGNPGPEMTLPPPPPALPEGKASACNAGNVSLRREDPLEKEMATHSNTLPWRIPWTEESNRLYSPWGPKESDTTERLPFLSSTSWRRCPRGRPLRVGGMEALPGEAGLPALPSPQLPPPPGLLLRSWDSLPAAKNAHGLPGRWGRTRGPHPSPSARILRALGGSSWGKLRPRGWGGGVRGPRAPGVRRSFGGCALVGSLHPPLFNRESVQGEAAGLGARVGVEGGVGRGPGRRPGRGRSQGPSRGSFLTPASPQFSAPHPYP